MTSLSAHPDVPAATPGAPGSAMAWGGAIVGSPPLPPGLYAGTPWAAAWPASRQRPEQQQQPHAPIRKTVSASQLNVSPMPPGLPTSDPLQSSTKRHQPPLRRPSLSGTEGSGGDHQLNQHHPQQLQGGQQQPAVLPLLDEKQLQQLQQIADAAKMQVLVQSAQLARPVNLPWGQGGVGGSPPLGGDFQFQVAKPPL